MSRVIEWAAIQLLHWIVRCCASFIRAVCMCVFFIRRHAFGQGAAQQPPQQKFPTTPWAILNFPELPRAWQLQLVQQLSPADRLALFKCSHAAALMVLQHAQCVKLTMSRRRSVRTGEARSQYVAMCLAEGACNLHLRVGRGSFDCDDILIAPPRCIRSSITALDIHLSGAGDANSFSLHKLWVRLPRLTSLSVTPRDMMRDLSQLGAMFGRTIKQLSICRAGVRAAMLPSIAALYPCVTHLDLKQYPWDQPHEAAEFLLHQWRSVQCLAVACLRLHKEINCYSRSWQQLDYRRIDWNTLAYLPLEAFKRVVMHDTLCMPKDGVRRMEAVLVLNKLRLCASVQITGAVHAAGPSMPEQAGFYLWDLSPSALTLALEVLGLTTCQPPSLCLILARCSLNDPVWMSYMHHIPTGVSTLVFLGCQFRRTNEELYWAQFAASLPAQVEAVAVQVETYQQAVALVTAIGRSQHPTNLWLYRGRSMPDAPDWQADLLQLGGQVRPSLELHVLNCLM